MYQRILVPLDGSALAECVLPHVQVIAKGCNVQDIRLVSVVEPAGIPSSSDFTNLSEEQRKQIESDRKAYTADYLNRIVNQLKQDGIVAQSEVLLGAVAENIADYASKNDVDLIIIATHGRSGVSRWVWGSVADRILRSSCVPVLMVRAPGCVPGI